MSTPHEPHARPREQYSSPYTPTPVPTHAPAGPGGGGGRPLQQGLAKVIAVAAAVALFAGVAAYLATGDSRRASGAIDRDAARELCTQGDMVACDDLLAVAPQDSEDQDFALTCGNRRSGPTGGLVLFGRQMMVGGNCEEWSAGR